MSSFELAQESVKINTTNTEYSINNEFKNLCQKVVSEGIVLLKNNDILPIVDKKVSVFGRCQINSFCTGYGSGGDVNAPYKVSIIEGLINARCNVNKDLVSRYKTWCKKHVPYDGEWGTWPFYYEEMMLRDDTVLKASLNSEIAIVIVARSAGEDRDIKVEDGSWYLTKKERKLLSQVRKYFNKVCVVINSGSIMDVNEILSYNPDALLFAWQGGQEFGNGLAGVLVGDFSPSGKLTDTIAKIEDYPSTKYMNNPNYTEYVEDIYVGYRYFNTFAEDKIIYPFGYGLSYSKFDISCININLKNNILKFKIKVQNIGNYKAKEVIQLYLSKPQGLLGNPCKELIWYKKTKELNINESELIEGSVNIFDFAPYDDTGVTNYKNSFILEKGQYHLYLGVNSLENTDIYSFDINENILVEKCNEACSVNIPFERIVNDGGIKYKTVPLNEVNIKERILNSLDDNNRMSIAYYDFNDVLENKITLNEFVNSLDEEELEALTRGSLYAMDSPYGPDGNAGSLGASTEKLFNRNIPAISTNDGPSGARLKATSTLIPNGVTLASTFNDELIENLTYHLGLEVRKNNSHILLAPGLNIHRNPLCGRNFEYYSEDPYLSGMIASAYVRGVQSAKTSACPKHFACNSQEYCRHVHDSRVSQRALREIYLKGFKLCIDNANPDVIMTSYNKINGEYAYYNFDLVNTILKSEWQFKGLVITDWWMRDDYSKVFENVKTQAYRIRAGIDVYMPGAYGNRTSPGKSDGTLISSLYNNGITLSEIRKSAKRLLQYIINYINK